MRFSRERWIEISRYLAVGFVTTGVNLALFFIFDRVLSWHYLWANAMAIMGSILFAYVANKLYVFQSQKQSKKEILLEMLAFFSFRAISAAMDMLTLWLLVAVFSFPSSLAKLLTQGLVVISNYFFSKFIIFRKG